MSLDRVGLITRKQVTVGIHRQHDRRMTHDLLYDYVNGVGRTQRMTIQQVTEAENLNRNLRTYVPYWAAGLEEIERVDFPDRVIVFGRTEASYRELIEQERRILELELQAGKDLNSKYEALLKSKSLTEVTELAEELAHNNAFVVDGDWVYSGDLEDVLDQIRFQRQTLETTDKDVGGNRISFNEI